MPASPIVLTQSASTGAKQKGEKTMGIQLREVLICDTHEEMADAQNIGVKDPKKCNGTAVRKYEIYIPARVISEVTEKVITNEAGDKSVVQETVEKVIPGRFKLLVLCDKAAKPYADFIEQVKDMGEDFTPEQFQKSEENGQATLPGMNGSAKPKPSNASSAEKDRANAACREWCQRNGVEVSARGRISDVAKMKFCASEEGRKYANVLL